MIAQTCLILMFWQSHSKLSWQKDVCRTTVRESAFHGERHLQTMAEPRPD